jgi:Na+-transporting NADH:ubiquinone oxidoreductase subunit NqrB
MAALNLLVITAKRLIILGVVALALWHITVMLTSGVDYGKVLVYVSEQPSILTIDRQHYSITKQVSLPLICELRPGEHQLRLEQNGRKVYEHSFTVEARREQTLFAPGRTAGHAKLATAINLEPEAGRVVQQTAFHGVRRTGSDPEAAKQ